MTRSPDDTPPLEPVLVQSQSADWRTRQASVAALAAYADDERAMTRMIELVVGDDNLAVIESASAALALHGRRGLTGLARVFGRLDDQSGTYAGLAVSDALGDDVYEKLLDAAQHTDERAVREGLRQMGLVVGMDKSPLWQRAFPT